MGIGGILRNHFGDILCMFSEFSGFGLSSDVGVSAILKACKLCESANCPFDVDIIIESDSKSTVSWVNGKGGVGNVKLMESILNIREFLHRFGARVLVQYVPRSGNVSADLLAKLGALSEMVQEVWV
ncbi:hypothetical protein Q3G72_013406 [Acer saccharum]|nr:hypothetical protein Q3G72_013406 [Acer saccharum]